MELKLDDHYLLQDVKEKFNQRFPFLKIDFLLDPNDTQNSVGLNNLINEKKALAKYRTSPGIIIISEKQKVSELNHLFKKKYGLIVKVFRKVGDIWLPITSTDDWTIEKQNSEGHKMSSF